MVETPLQEVQSYLNSLTLEELQQFVLAKLQSDADFAADVELFQKRHTGSDKDAASYFADAQQVFATFVQAASEQDSLKRNEALALLESSFEGVLNEVNRFLQFGGWAEASKAYQGILQASATTAEDSTDVASQAIRRFSADMLGHWASTLNQLPVGKERTQALQAFVAFFLEEDFDFGAMAWETAFRSLVHSKEQAQTVLKQVNAVSSSIGRKLKELEKQPSKAAVLLFLFDLGGKTRDFEELATKTYRKVPQWSLALARLQLDGGDEKAASETTRLGLRALDSSRQQEPLEELLRFSVRELELNDETLYKQAFRLVTEFEKEQDFSFLMGVLRTREARAQLLEDVQKKTTPSFALQILHQYGSLEDVLSFAQSNTDTDVLPEAVEILSHRYAEDCFELYKAYLLNLLKMQSGVATYNVFPHHLNAMSALPGYSEKTRDFATQLLKKYRQRYKFREVLQAFLEQGGTAVIDATEADEGILAVQVPEVVVSEQKTSTKKTTKKTGGNTAKKEKASKKGRGNTRSPNARAQRRRKKKRAPGNEYVTNIELNDATKIKVKELEPLMQEAPFGDEQRDALQEVGIKWQPGIFRLIWAVLKLHHGKLSGKAISEWISFIRGCGKNSTAALRSLGLKALEHLDLVEVERSKNRVTEVRLR